MFDLVTNVEGCQIVVETFDTVLYFGLNKNILHYFVLLILFRELVRLEYLNKR